MSEQVQCPECNEVQRDLWDHDWGTRETITTGCGSCGKDYVLARHVSVSYEAMRVVAHPRTNVTDACLHSPSEGQRPCPPGCTCWCDECRLVRVPVVGWPEKSE